MLSRTPCEACSFEVLVSADRCPHCGRPGRFPNVLMAALKEEGDALDARYDSALGEAEGRGLRDAVSAFESAARSSQAVMTRPSGELLRLANGDNELYATYYKLLGVTRLPTGGSWDLLRAPVDEALFPTFKEEIRFAALSLDGRGLPHYGDCFITLREAMIAHRASVFEENTVVFMKRRGVTFGEADKLTRGFRATWGARAKLCVAKLTARVSGDMDEAARADLLLSPAGTPDADDFVEVHIYGPMTARTFERVRFLEQGDETPARAIIAAACAERLQGLGVVID
jgi:hypothetical protein